MTKKNPFVEVLQKGDVQAFAKLRKQAAEPIVLDGLVLEAVSLAGIDLSGVTIRKSTLDAVNLHGANLDEVTLEQVVLTGVYLKDASLRGAVVIDSTFDSVKFTNAVLSGTKIGQKTMFVGCNFDDANLQHMEVQDTTFKAVSMARADMSHSALKDVVLLGVNQEGLVSEGVKHDNVLPHGVYITRPAAAQA